MEDLVREIAKEVPSLAVLVFIVYVFLKHISQSAQAMKDIHLDCHDTQAKSVAALDRFGEKMDHLADVVEERYTNGARV